MAWLPTTLIIGPGGVKGFLEIGAMGILELFRVLPNIRRVIGVSVGSILSLLWVSGCNYSELVDHALTVDLIGDIFVTKPFRRGLFMSNNGFFSTAGIETYLTKILLEKFSHIPTLGELYERTKLELVIVSTDVTACEPVYLSHLTEPNLSCIKAVLMSVSIPIVFEYQELNEHRYVDGALTDPLPIQLYPEENQLVLRIVDNANRGSDLFSYVYTALSVSIDYMIKEKLARLMSDEGFRKRCRILELVAPNFNPVNPSMDRKEKLNMINQGGKTATEFIVGIVLRDTPNAIPASPDCAPECQPFRSGGNLRRRLRPLPQLSAESVSESESGDCPAGSSPDRKDNAHP